MLCLVWQISRVARTLIISFRCCRVMLETGVSALASCSDWVLINDWEEHSLKCNKCGSSDFTKSPAAGIATFSEPRLMSQVGRVFIDQCVSVFRAVEVPVFLWTLFMLKRHFGSQHVSRCHQTTPGVLDDICCLSFVEDASGWAEVDTWPLIHCNCYHMTEAGELYGLWDLHWRLSFKITRSLWNYCRYKYTSLVLIVTNQSSVLFFIYQLCKPSEGLKTP